MAIERRKEHVGRDIEIIATLPESHTSIHRMRRRSVKRVAKDGTDF